MDRPPEDPTPDDPAPDEGPAPVEPSPARPAPPAPVSPYGPAGGEDGTALDAAGPPARPYERARPPASGEQAPPPDAPAEMAYPPVPQAPAPINPMPMAPQPEAKDSGPGLGAGLATGCGLQVVAVILFFFTAGIALGFFGALWPFILVTVGSALLMLSKRWRRFATGALIISAAAWLTIIGPCVLILNGGFSSL